MEKHSRGKPKRGASDVWAVTLLGDDQSEAPPLFCANTEDDRDGSLPRLYSHWRPHPWHGLDVGRDPPRVVHAYIEITPFDLVKYEVDKVSGYLRVDRPQRTSSQPPALYGFVPRTYCGTRVSALCGGCMRGDGDPLDICVISERPITKSEVILNATVVGGIQMVDGGEADDKIVAVLENDSFWGNVQDISELPNILVERLQHYFGTYKLVPGRKSQFSIRKVYDHTYAHRVVEAAIEDYAAKYREIMATSD